MMSIKEYAEDVGLTVEEVKALCDKLGINYEDENTLLDDLQIVELDNASSDITSEDDSEETKEEDYEDEYDEEVEDKAEELAQNTKFDLDNSTSFERVKKSGKRNETTTNKTRNKNFLKERKKMYKHRENL